MVEVIGWMLISVFFGLLPQMATALLSIIESKEKNNG